MQGVIVVLAHRSKKSAADDKSQPLFYQKCKKKDKSFHFSVGFAFTKSDKGGKIFFVLAFFTLEGMGHSFIKYT